MKSSVGSRQSIRCKSHPARGAWIEIYPDEVLTATMLWSHPARGAWIEILEVGQTVSAGGVAPRKGCVD